MTCGDDRSSGPSRPARRLVAAPDKFRGTAAAASVAGAVGRAARARGWRCDEVPVADGGEGTLEALGGDARHATVRGPLGGTVSAEWRWRGEGEAVVEMARASGLQLVGGPAGNDPLRATTYGTGELVAAALDAGADRVLVGMGGSATTDGGLGAISALRTERRRGRSWARTDVVVACDVTTTFVDAAEHFAPQKGASAAQVSLLRRRLERLAQVYERDFGVDVRDMPGAGAAGGLAGGLAALGATLVPGFDLVAEEVDLAGRLDGADLVVTGEGRLDAESFAGKAVGGVVALAARSRVPVLVVAGEVEGDAVPPGWSGSGVRVVSLVERFGGDRGRGDVLGCVEAVVADHLAAQGRR
ncbi:MAG: glycerate kinase [Acidimicrobiales bacterium]